jgi:hypothetical protein
VIPEGKGVPWSKPFRKGSIDNKEIEKKDPLLFALLIAKLPEIDF